jgi:hypothetical protein
MYCYNCGAKIYNGLSSCPKCDVGMKPIEYILFMETVDMVEPYCPDVDIDMKKEFNVEGKIVDISGKEYISGLCSQFISIVYRNSLNTLIRWAEANSFDDIIKYGDKIINNIALAVSYDAIGFMKKIGYDVNPDLIEHKFSKIFDLRYFWSYLDSMASLVDCLSQEMDEARKNMNTPRTSRWVGGGFGVAGAVKGAINAKMLNVAGDVVHGMGNVARSQMRKAYDKHQIKVAKDEIKQSAEFINNVRDSWTRQISNLYEYLKTVVKDKSVNLGGEYQFLNLNDLNGGFNYLKCTYQQAKDLLNKNMYDFNGYINLYRGNRNLGKPLYEIATFLGVGDELLEKYVIYVDCDLIRQLKIEDLGFGIPEDELRTRMSQIIELEKNNPIYSLDSKLDLVKREQNYKIKLTQLCQDYNVLI